MDCVFFAVFGFACYSLKHLSHQNHIYSRIDSESCETDYRIQIKLYRRVVEWDDKNMRFLDINAMTEWILLNECLGRESLSCQQMECHCMSVGYFNRTRFVSKVTFWLQQGQRLLLIGIWLKYNLLPDSSLFCFLSKLH